MIGIEKIDKVMDRTGASYEEVKTALLASDGDIDQATIYILQQRAQGQADGADSPDAESKGQETVYHHGGAFASDIIDTIKYLWEKGNASTLIIEKGGKQLLNLSLTMGTIGLVIAPVAAIIGLGAALITEYTIIVILDDGKVINVNELALTRKSTKEPKNPQDGVE